MEEKDDLARGREYPFPYTSGSARGGEEVMWGRLGVKGVYRSGGLGELPLAELDGLRELIPSAVLKEEDSDQEEGDDDDEEEGGTKSTPKYCDTPYFLVFHLTASCCIAAHVILVAGEGIRTPQNQPFLPLGSNPLPASARHHRKIPEHRIAKLNGAGTHGLGALTMYLSNDSMLFPSSRPDLKDRHGCPMVPICKGFGGGKIEDFESVIASVKADYENGTSGGQRKEKYRGENGRRGATMTFFKGCSCSFSSQTAHLQFPRLMRSGGDKKQTHQL